MVMIKIYFQIKFGMTVLMNKNKVAIIDYGINNISSLTKAFNIIDVKNNNNKVIQV